MLIVLGVKAFKIIVSFAFVSRRTYQFSDMYYVTNAVYKEIYRNLLHLNKGKMFTHDTNFQKYYKKMCWNFSRNKQLQFGKRGKDKCFSRKFYET